MYLKKFKLVSLLILAATLPVIAAQADVELVVNGGFEDGLTGWNILEPPVFDGELSMEQAHSGLWSLKLDVVDFVEQVFATPVDPTGDLTFWARAAAGLTGPAAATIYYTDTSYNFEYFGASLVSPLEWRMFTVPVEHPKLVERIEFSVWESEAIFIDDVSLPGPDPVTTTSDPVTTTSDPAEIPTFGFSGQLIVAIALISVTGSILRKRMD